MKLILLLLVSLNLQALEYRCTLDLSPRDTILTQKNIKNFIKVVEYDSSKTKIGTQATFKDIDVKIWKKGEHSIAMIKDLKRKIAVTSKFSPTQDELYLKLSPSIIFECMTADKWNKEQSPILQNLYIPKIGKMSDLGQMRHNVFFKTRKQITFNYRQAGSNGKMRILFFQSGKVSSSKDASKPWCAFQVEIKLDEDTTLYPGTILPPSKVKLLESGSDQQVVSYSFIDFGTGKRTYHTSRFTPFSLQCKLPKSEKLTYEKFRVITGNHFELMTGGK